MHDGSCKSFHDGHGRDEEEGGHEALCREDCSTSSHEGHEDHDGDEEEDGQKCCAMRIAALAAVKAIKVMKKQAATKHRVAKKAARAKAMNVMKKQAAMKHRVAKKAARAKAMNVMKKQAAMKRGAMKAAAPAPMKAMKAMSECYPCCCSGWLRLFGMSIGGLPMDYFLVSR
jgi:hypothetical protein